jgi:hypothetical protein
MVCDEQNQLGNLGGSSRIGFDQVCARAIPSIATGALPMSTDREKILSALSEKPLKVFEVMKRVNIPNEEACQSLLLKMRSEGVVKFDIHKGRWQLG